METTDGKRKKNSEALVETLYTKKAGKPALMPKSLKMKYSMRQKRIQRKKRRKKRKRIKKPSHYKLVCISLYLKDIEKLEAHVRFLKGRGYTKASKSQIIRFAIDRVPIIDMPRAI